MFVDKATIHYDNEIEVTMIDSDLQTFQLRQRYDEGEWSPPFVLHADELRELVELAKFLGWEV